MKLNLNRGKYFLFLLYLFIDLSFVVGQQLDFEKYYFNNFSYNYENYYVIKTSDNNFLMTGNTVGFNNSYFLLKINQLGDSIWLKTPPFGGLLSSGQTIKELSNGNYALLCVESSAYQRLLLVIYDSLGNILSSNHFNVNGNLYVTNISESNGFLFVLGQQHSSFGTYLIKTNLSGDSLGYHSDTTFVIANHNNSVCFDGSNFVAAGTTIDSSGTYFPSIEKFDTSGNVLWKVDYPQFSGGTGSELFRYSDGYIFKTISMTNGPNIIRIDSTGSILWNTQISQNLSSVISPDNSRILVVSDAIELYWYDSTGAYIQGESFPLTLPGIKYVVNAFVDNQQIYVSGTQQTGQSPIYSSGFLVQLTDTSIVSTNDLQRIYNNYVYPTICSLGGQIKFHASEKIPIDTKYTIHNSLGKVVSTGIISISDPYSDAIIKIPNSIGYGIFYLKIFSNNSNYTFRFIVQ